MERNSDSWIYTYPSQICETATPSTKGEDSIPKEDSAFDEMSKPAEKAVAFLHAEEVLVI